MRRRRVLETAGGLGLAGLSGCLSLPGGGEGDAPDDEADEDDAAADDPTETADSAETPTETEAPTEAGTSTGTADLVYGFEGTLNSWTVEDAAWGRSELYAWSGDASAGIETSTGAGRLASTDPAELDGGTQIDALSYYWRETAESEGGGLSLENADGDVELFVGSDNPQWVVINQPEGTEFTELYEGDGYDRWVRIDLSFDWDADTVSVTFTDTDSQTSRSGTYDLAQGANVETIGLTGFTHAEFENGDGFEAESCYMYWDDIQVTL